jgi:hypothetical protein
MEDRSEIAGLVAVGGYFVPAFSLVKVLLEMDAMTDTNSCYLIEDADLIKA